MLQFEERYWQEGYQLVAGVDEAGRGPLCGPVVAAAVILYPLSLKSSQTAKAVCCDHLLTVKQDISQRSFNLNEDGNLFFNIIKETNDSKCLSASKREELYSKITQVCLCWATALATVREIERFNILQASLLAMRRAVIRLNPLPEIVLIDGPKPISGLPLLAVLPPQILKQEAIIGGDSKSLSVAAASILAKVTRDRYMQTIHKKHPQYGLNSHKGYPTIKHRQAILEEGLLPSHRITFKGVKESLWH